MFVVKDLMTDDAHARALEHLPLRAAFVTTSDGLLLAMRTTGAQVSALNDAVTAITHLQDSQFGPLQFTEVRMIEHRMADEQLNRNEPVKYIGVSECAEALGVIRQRVQQLISQDKLPRP